MKFISISIMLILSLFFSGCGGDHSLNNSSSLLDNSELETEDSKVIFHIGNKTKIASVDKRSIFLKTVSKDDFLNNVQTICLQIFIEENYEPVYGQCQPVLNGKYPNIEVDYDKLPNEKFKAQLVGYMYETSNWKSINSGILAKTNTKIFDDILVDIGIQDIYMGDLYAVDSVKVSLYISDSTWQTDFSDFQKVTLVTENGRKIEYQSDYESKSTDYKWSEFWIEKNTDYKMLCLDEQCYYIYSDFNFFNSSSFDIAKAKKVEMIPVNSDNICTIKYNQNFHQIIPTDTKYIFEHYVSIEDCDQSRYQFEVIVDTYFPDLQVELSGDTNRYVIMKNDETLRFVIHPSNEESAYFYLSYHLVEPDLVGISFYPHMYVDVIDTETGQIVQTEEFDLTSFEFE